MNAWQVPAAAATAREWDVAIDRVRACSHSAGRVVLFSPAGIEVPLETDTLVARRGALDAYEQRVKALRPLYAGYSVAEHWLTSPWLNEREVFSIRGMLKLSWPPLC